ncbi:MAG: baseplate J/gp47 family protein [Burkholderia gladioli]
MSLLDRQLPEPTFIDRDPAKITADMIAMYEQLTGKTLFPAQLERLLVNVFAYRENLIREAIQDTGKLNLVRYSRAPILDYLGENVDCGRILAAPANCTLQFAFDAAVGAAVIPAGTQVGTDILFATTADIPIAAGATSATATAQCTVAGAAANGFVAGQINGLVGAVPGLSINSAQNITTTQDGADDEDDDHYRERIVLAPESFSSTGPDDAYRFWALSAHRDIVAVAVRSPKLSLNGNQVISQNGVPPGNIQLYPLMKAGLPSQAIKDQVYAICSDRKRRPLTDYVQVLDPVKVPYRIVAALTLFDTADQSLALAQANDTITKWTAKRQQQLGLDIVREQIIGILNGPNAYGVYDTNLTEPPQNVVVSDEQWAYCTGITLTIAGTTSG